MSRRSALFPRLLALSCALCLLAPWASAQEVFPVSRSYPEGYYADVPAGSWYAAPAKTCYERGLMTGTAENAFAPQRTLSVAETAAIAARLRAALCGQEVPRATALPGQSRPWYQDYVDYLYATIETSSGGFPGAADVLSRPETTVSRKEFLALLDLALSQNHDQFAPINSIEALPDTDDPTVLWFYNLGVLTGVDDAGTFRPDRSLTRAECAAMVARIADPALRQSFTPTAPDPEQTYEEALLQAEALRVNGVSVSFQSYLDTLNAIIFRTDYTLAAQSGSRLDWNAKYQGIDDLAAYFKDQAAAQVVRDALVTAQAKALGCSVDELPARLTPDPTSELDHIYRAKHILVDDEATAQALLAELMAQPTQAHFDQLMKDYNTDPGMASNPDGYLFTDGDMVPEFENAVKALKVGACSAQPVKSSFGYHLILRLDPTGLDGWQARYQALKYEDYVDGWVASATVTRNDAELDKLDVPARYAAYLAQLGEA